MKEGAFNILSSGSSGGDNGDNNENGNGCGSSNGGEWWQ